MVQKREENKQLRMGVPVYCQDGHSGKISKVITDPESQAPTYIVVKLGKLRTREVVVPVSLIEDIQPEGVRLQITCEALADFPEYETTIRTDNYGKPIPVGQPRPHDIVIPAQNRGYMAIRQRSVPDNAVEVKEGMPVVDVEGETVGKVKGLVLKTGERTGKYVVFRTGRAAPLRLIPKDLIADVDSERVQLSIHKKYAHLLPDYLDQLADELFPDR